MYVNKLNQRFQIKAAASNLISEYQRICSFYMLVDKISLRVFYVEIMQLFDCLISYQDENALQRMRLTCYILITNLMPINRIVDNRRKG